MSNKTKSTNELWQLLQKHARSFSKRKALSTPQTDLTFENLFRIAERLVTLIAGANVLEGSIVILALPNSLAFIATFLALLKLSATVGLVSHKYRASELQAIINGVHPRGLLTTTSMAEVLKQKIALDKIIVLPTAELGEDLVLLFPAKQVSLSPSGFTQLVSDIPLPSGSTLIKFTSGSTGEPKGIAWTVENVLAEAQNVVATLEITPADCILAPVPIFHSYGFDLGVLPMLFAGSTLVLRENFVPRRILSDFSSARVTIFLGVPSMYRFFVETHLSFVPDLFFIRYLLSCTAPLHHDLISEFHKKYHMPICQHYGSSETGAATTHIPAEVLNRPQSVGLAMKNVELKIVDEQDKEMPSGKEGEVTIRSKAVADGYIMGNPPGKSMFRDGSYWTGDLGIIDEAGFLYLRGRKNEIINVGGLKVSPHEVTQVLKSFPAVREAAVIGFKDASGEEVVYAVVTLKNTATEKEILSYCHTHLADYKVPRRIDIRNEMPLGPSGKINLRAENLQL
jgi:long-chain acyl-CoA synthetase